MTTNYVGLDAIGGELRKGDIVASAQRGQSSRLMLAVVVEVSRAGGLKLVQIPKEGTGYLGRKARSFQVIRIDNPKDIHRELANEALAFWESN